MLDVDENLIVNNYLEAYLIYINKFPNLSKEEIANLYQKGEYETIYNHNLRLVPFVVKHFVKKRGNLSIMDLIQEGNIGLKIAIDKFDYTLNTAFSTYAIYHITQKISHIIATQSRTINYTYDMHYKIIKYNKTVNNLINTLGRYPTKEEIASNSNLTIKQIDNILNNLVNTYTLDTQNNQESTNKEDKIINNILLEKIINHAKLSKKEFDILNLYYYQNKTSKEISLIYNCTRQNVECILNTLLTKLKNAYQEINLPKINKLDELNINEFYYCLKMCSIRQNIQYFKFFTPNLIDNLFNYSLLNNDEKQILTLLFGINHYYVLNYKEIAEQYNLSYEEIKKITKTAFTKLTSLVKVLHPNVSSNKILIKKNQL